MTMTEQLSATLQEERAYWQKQGRKATEQRHWRGQARWMRLTRDAFSLEKSAITMLEQAETARAVQDTETASIYTEMAVRHLSTVWFEWDCALAEIAGGTPFSGFTLTKGERKKQEGEAFQTLTLEHSQWVGALIQRIYQIRVRLCAMQMEINGQQQKTLLAFLQTAATRETGERDQ